MSDEIGPVAYRQGEHHPFLGKEIHESREFSEETAHLIDQEIKVFLHAAQAQATRVLMEHRSELDSVSAALLDRESLGRDDLVKLIGDPVARAYAEDAVTGDTAAKEAVDEATSGKSNAESSSSEPENDEASLESETLLEKPEDRDDGGQAS